jgi:hypothetical protein
LRAAFRSNIIISDQNSSSSRCRASFSLALKHGIYCATRFRFDPRLIPFDAGPPESFFADHHNAA